MLISSAKKCLVRNFKIFLCRAILSSKIRKTFSLENRRHLTPPRKNLLPNSSCDKCLRWWEWKKNPLLEFQNLSSESPFHKCCRIFFRTAAAAEGGSNANSHRSSSRRVSLENLNFSSRFVASQWRRAVFSANFFFLQEIRASQIWRENWKKRILSVVFAQILFSPVSTQKTEKEKSQVVSLKATRR